MLGRVCKRCWLWFPLVSLKKDASCKYGRQRICKGCQSKKKAVWYTDNQEKAVEYSKFYYATNTEQVLEKNRSWYKANKKQKQETSKIYYEANKEQVLEKSKSWYEANKERKARVGKIWNQANPDKVLDKTHRRRALEKNTTIGTVDYVAITARAAGICYLCGEELGQHKTHYDHIIPLSKGGPHVTENIALVHAICNLRKGSNIYDQLPAHV